MSLPEYLVTYGLDGFLGRFAAETALSFERGDQVIVRSHRGLERGTVVSRATAEHARFLPDQMLGKLIDIASARLGSCDPGDAYEHSCRLVRELGLPAEIVDAEVLLEPRTIIVHYLRTGPGALRPLIQPLSEAFAAVVELHDLSLGIATEYGDRENQRRCAGGCGDGGCASGGGCGSGGCSNGGCGSKKTVQLQPGELLQAELGIKPLRPH